METLKKIRVGVFFLTILLIAMAVILCVAGVLPFWAMLLFILFPFGVLFSALFWLCLFTVIGDRLMAKNPPSCQNCKWGKARDVVGHCVGEALGEEFGKVCDKYVRDVD